MNNLLVRRSWCQNTTDVSTRGLCSGYDSAALHALHQQWINKGIPIILQPMKMYFDGIHFMGLDPDGHRLRVATPD